MYQYPVSMSAARCASSRFITARPLACTRHMHKVARSPPGYRGTHRSNIKHAAPPAGRMHLFQVRVDERVLLWVEEVGVHRVDGLESGNVSVPVSIQVSSSLEVDPVAVLFLRGVHAWSPCR